MNPPTDLDFATLRDASVRRGKLWNNTGRPFTLEFAALELCGEVGELANAVKKLVRHQMGVPGGVDDPENLRDECADVVICVDLLCQKLGIDLGAAVVEKFNKTSRKHGFEVML